MIFKIPASLILFYLCVYVSKEEKNKLKYRYEYLTGIINALIYLKKEITFFSSYLGDAMINAAQYAGIANQLFDISGNYIINNNSDGFEKIFLENLKTTDLRVKLIMKEFAVQVGTSDTENEEILIDNTVIKLTEITDEYKNILCGRGKLISRIGIIAGIFLAILVL